MKKISRPRVAHVLATVLLVVMAFRGIADEKSRRSALEKTGPEDTADLLEIQEAATKVATKALACTVGLQVGRNQGSAVIVSEDGYVLTAAHVIGTPGRDARIRLPDGSAVKGKTLGIHTVADIGLVKITDDGNWPYAPLVSPDEGPKAGDWCLTTGHPNGFQIERAAPVRLGRVIDVQKSVLRTDCPVMGGDSGGPLFDMQGRVIGIHSRIGGNVTANLHGPALACVEVWKELEAGRVYPTRPLSRFLDRLDIDRDGKVTRAELPEGLHRRVFDRFVARYELDPKEEYSIETLTKTLGWRTSPMPFLGPTDGGREQFGESLSRRLFVRGSRLREPFAEAVADISESTVRVTCEDEPVALGVVVAADGWIVTKASQLTGEATCELSDGRQFAARLVEVEKEYDLALLRVAATELKAVDCPSSASLSPGTWLVTPGFDRQVASVGVVSVGLRTIVPTRAWLGVQITTEEAALVAGVLKNSGAEAAGIQDGDVITHITDRAVDNLDELRKVLQEYRAGDVVTATIVRGSKTFDVDVTLGASNDMFPQFGRAGMSGPLSRRRDGFPQAIQHDSVLHPTMCGGPVVDISGRLVGVNIARADRIATYAIPLEAIRSFVKQVTSEAASSPPNNDQ